MIVFDGLTFSYGDSRKLVLDGISLEINDGEFVLLSGLSGSGKSTLLKAMNGLVPHFYGGRYKGDVFVDGVSVRAASVAQLGGAVGMVFQDSSSQIIAETADDEIAFGPANMGLDEGEIAARIERAARMMNIEDLLGRRTATLSGGEKQKLAITAVLSMRPGVLALDEPFAELDNDSADELLELLVSLNKNEGITVVMAEHRIEKVLAVADRVIEVEQGRLLENTVAQVNQKIVIASGAKQSQEGDHPAEIAASAKIQPPRKDTICINNLSFAYGGRAVLDGFDMAVRAGEIVALAGPNGCGKTTLLRLICGFLSPSGGEINVAGLRVGQTDRTELFRQIGYVPQRPSALLFAETVEDEVYGTAGSGRLLSRKELLHSLRSVEDYKKYSSSETSKKYSSSEPRSGESRSTTLLEEFGLADVAGEYPRDLSWGQQQRVALAAVLAKDPKVILLDEPTHGLDSGAKERLADLLKTLAARGAAIIIATHDKEMAKMTADRIVQLSN